MRTRNVNFQGWLFWLAASGCVACDDEGDAARPSCETTSLLRRDRDGDGYGNPDEIESACVVKGQTPAGFATELEDDCDDTDESAFKQYFPDADGDKETSAAGSPVCAGASPPLGYSANSPSDCDDSDVFVNRSASEQWDDGKDSNCDGNENPRYCEADADYCECALVGGGASVALDPDCSATPDAAIEVFEACASCGVAHHFVVVTNKGGVALGQGITLRAQQTHGIIVSIEIGALASGESSLPIVVDAPEEGLLTVELSGLTSSDCNPENDARSLEVAIGECK